MEGNGAGLSRQVGEAYEYKAFRGQTVHGSHGSDTIRVTAADEIGLAARHG